MDLPALFPAINTDGQKEQTGQLVQLGAGKLQQMGTGLAEDLFCCPLLA